MATKAKRKESRAIIGSVSHDLRKNVSQRSDSTAVDYNEETDDRHEEPGERRRTAQIMPHSRACSITHKPFLKICLTVPHGAEHARKEDQCILARESSRHRRSRLGRRRSGRRRRQMGGELEWVTLCTDLTLMAENGTFPITK